MGKYINGIGTTFAQKEAGLKELGAVEIPTPEQFEEDLVCLVDNGLFAAAAYAFSEKEMQYFREDPAGRPQKWFKLYEAAEFAK